MNGAAAARSFRLALSGYALLRLAALLLPSMFLWGLNAGRFANPAAAALLWLLPALALAPAAGPLLERLCDRLAVAAGPPRAAAGLAFLAAALVALLLPDQVWFVGDYLLREGAMRQPGDFLRMFPQAQPLDVLLHHDWPQALLGRGIDSTAAARAGGAIEAGLLALLARRFALGFGLAPGRTLAVAVAALAGGAFALFAGYAKPTVEVCLLTFAAGVFAVDLVRTGRGVLPLALAFALALGFHRSAVGLLPGLVLVLALAARRHPSFAGRTLDRVAGLGVLAATLAFFLPRLWRLFGAFDLATNFTSFEVQSQGGPIAAAFSGLRLLDLANLAALHAPLALMVPALGRPRAPSPQGEPGEPPVRLALAVLFAGHLPSILFTYVTQGAFRDWDVHAGAFATLALWAAAWLAVWLRAHGDRPGAAGLAQAAALAAVGATLTLMVAQNDLGRGLERTRAFLAGPPARTESQQLATLDFLALRTLRLERFGESADAFGALAARAPHPRALLLHGTAAILAGRDAEGLGAFERLVGRDSSHAIGWFGVWLGARRTGDSALAATAERRVLALPDTGEAMGSILDLLAHYPGLVEKMPKGSFRPN